MDVHYSVHLLLSDVPLTQIMPTQNDFSSDIECGNQRIHLLTSQPNNTNPRPPDKLAHIISEKRSAAFRYYVCLHAM